jgi:hypothetical protein
MLNKLIREFPPELQLMLTSADSDLDKTKYLLQQPINWDKFLHLAAHHRVYPLVYKTLSLFNNLLMPEYVLDALKQKCQDNALNALRITGEMVRIVNILENHGISPVVLKGAPLSWRLYGDIAARPYGDIDLLVTADKLEQAKAIMQNEGFCRISDYDSYNLTPRQLQIYLKYHEHGRHFMYWHSKKNVLCEIHWKLNKFGNELPFPSEGNIKKIVLAGSPMPVLSDEECLLYLVMHGAGHQWHRLRWLIDIKKFMQQENIDWAGLNRQAEKFGIQLFFHQALILVNHMFFVPLPPGLEPDVVRDRKARRLAYMALQAHNLNAGDQTESQSAYYFFVHHSYYLSMNRGFRNKFNYVLKIIGPRAEDIKLVALPDRLYALYFFIGPLAYITRRLRRLIKDY